MLSFLSDQSFLDEVRSDLHREIPESVDAFERVGFVFATVDVRGRITPSHYMPIKDDHYVKRPPGYGACYNKNAIGEMIDRVLETNETVFTIHMHSGFGEPIPSPADIESEIILIQCLLRINKSCHGSIILSEDSLLVRSWVEDSQQIEKIINLRIERSLK